MKFYAGDFSLSNILWVDSLIKVETVIENNQHYMMQEAANIFKIPKYEKSYENPSY